MGWRDYSVQWLTYFRNGMACTSFSLQEKEKRLERTCGRCERERDGQCQADPGVLSLLVLLLFNLGLGLLPRAFFGSPRMAFPAPPWHKTPSTCVSLGILFLDEGLSPAPPRGSCVFASAHPSLPLATGCMLCSQGRNESSPTTHGRYEYIVYRDKNPVLL